MALALVNQVGVHRSVVIVYTGSCVSWLGWESGAAEGFLALGVQVARILLQSGLQPELGLGKDRIGKSGFKVEGRGGGYDVAFSDQEIYASKRKVNFQNMLALPLKYIIGKRCYPNEEYCYILNRVVWNETTPIYCNCNILYVFSYHE